MFAINDFYIYQNLLWLVSFGKYKKN